MTVLRPHIFLTVVLFLACGRVDYDGDAMDAGHDAATMDAGRDAAPDVSRDGASDATPDTAGDAVIDGAPDAAPDSSVPTPFGPPERVEELAMADRQVTNPTLSADQLEIFVVLRSSSGGAGDIYTATRMAPTAPFGGLTRVTELNSGGDESGLHLSRDGLTLWFASIRSGGLGNHDIYNATRPAPGMPFSAVVHIAEASSSMPESSPAVDESQTLLIMNRGSSPRDLYEARRPSAASVFAAPTLIMSLSHPEDDAAPELSPDGMTLYFSSRRPGGLGGPDLWMARRASPAGPFDPPTPLTELNSSGSDSVPWISADARTIYFASDRDGPTAIYRAVR